LKSQEINVAERKQFQLFKEDSAELKEVVVIGYGSVKKSMTVDQLNSKNFDNVAAPNQLIY
jgi:iron complex outermembrane receptor protein